MASVSLRGIHTKLTGYSKMTNRVEKMIRITYDKNKTY